MPSNPSRIYFQHSSYLPHYLNRNPLHLKVDKAFTSGCNYETFNCLCAASLQPIYTFGCNRPGCLAKQSIVVAITTSIHKWMSFRTWLTNRANTDKQALMCSIQLCFIFKYTENLLSMCKEKNMTNHS